MPGRYSCDGRDVSPPLTWSGVPLGTKALLLSVTDLDARGFVHWVAWDLVPDLGGLAEGASGALPDGAVEGRNDFGRIGWGGPCPPSGTHRYAFTLTALPAPLRLPRSTGLAAVQRGAAGATLRRDQPRGDVSALIPTGAGGRQWVSPTGSVRVASAGRPWSACEVPRYAGRVRRPVRETRAITNSRPLRVAAPAV